MERLMKIYIGQILDVKIERDQIFTCVVINIFLKRGVIKVKSIDRNKKFVIYVNFDELGFIKNLGCVIDIEGAIFSIVDIYSIHPEFKYFNRDVSHLSIGSWVKFPSGALGAVQEISRFCNEVFIYFPGSLRCEKFLIGTSFFKIKKIWDSDGRMVTVEVLPLSLIGRYIKRGRASDDLGCVSQKRSLEKSQDEDRRSIDKMFSDEVNKTYALAKEKAEVNAIIDSFANKIMIRNSIRNLEENEIVDLIFYCEEVLLTKGSK